MRPESDAWFPPLQPLPLSCRQLRHCRHWHWEPALPAVVPTVYPTSEAAGKGWTPASRHASARGSHSLGPLLLARSHGASRAVAGWRDRLPDSVHVLDVHNGPLLSRRAARATDPPSAITAAPARWGAAQHGVDDRASRIYPQGAWTAPLGRWPAGKREAAVRGPPVREGRWRQRLSGQAVCEYLCRDCPRGIVAQSCRNPARAEKGVFGPSKSPHQRRAGSRTAPLLRRNRRGGSARLWGHRLSSERDKRWSRRGAEAGRVDATKRQIRLAGRRFCHGASEGVHPPQFLLLRHSRQPARPPGFGPVLLL